MILRSLLKKLNIPSSKVLPFISIWLLIKSSATKLSKIIEIGIDKGDISEKYLRPLYGFAGILSFP